MNDLRDGLERDHRAEAQASVSRQTVMRSVALIGAFAAVVAYYYALVRRVWGGNSDTATPMLQAQAFAEGHLTLDGWAFLLDSFWTVDVPFYAVAYSVVGLEPQLTFVLPAVFAAVMLFLGLYLSVRGRSRREGVIASVVVLASMGLPAQGWSFLFLSLYGHGLTVLFCLLAFVAMRSSRIGLGWLCAVVLLALGLNGDLQTLPLGVGPLLGAGVVAMLRTRSVRGGLPAASAALASLLLAYIIRKAAVLVGTYDIGTANEHATVSGMLETIKRLPEFMFSTFGAGTGGPGSPAVVIDETSVASLYGHAIEASEIRKLVVGLVALVIVTSTIRMVREAVWRTGPASKEDDWRMDDALTLACLAVVAFVVFATISDDSGFRYGTSLVIFGSILAGRKVGPFVAGVASPVVRKALMVSGTAIATGCALASVTGLQQSVKPVTNADLASFLQEEGLSRGVGYYWVANQTTVAAHGDLVVRPVIGGPEGLAGRRQLSRDTWFTEPFQFLVCPATGEFESVSCEGAVAAYGEPARRLVFGSDEILVWSTPISVRY